MEIEAKPEVKQIQCCIACLKDEHEVQVDNNFDTKITEIYNTLVQEEINDFGLPSIAICGSCKNTLQLIIDFQKQCLKSIDSLKSKLNFYPELVVVKEELDLDAVFEETNEDTTLQKNLLEDEHADEKFSEESDSDKAPLVKPRKKYTPAKIKKEEKRNYCNQCDASYIRLIELQRHILKKHQGGSQCKYCRHVFVDKEEFKQHLKEEEAKARPDKTVCCDMCGFTTKWKPNLRHHITKYHTPDQPKLICDVCGKSYIFRHHFKMHFMNSHMEKNFPCNQCSLKFAFAFDLRKHINYFHSYEGTLKGPNALVKCKFCEKTLRNSSLKTHIQMVHKGLRNFSCDVCSQTYKTKGALKKHMWTNHDKSDPGSHPNYSSSQRQYKRKPQTQYNRKPQTRKPTICNECGLSFKKKVECYQHKLSTHVDKETLAKHYVSCKFCDFKLRPGSMRNHVSSVHMNCRKFKCEVCGNGFNTSGALNHHMYFHTGVKPFKCNICPHGYYETSDLRKHFEKDHDLQYTKEEVQKILGIKPGKGLNRLKL